LRFQKWERRKDEEERQNSKAQAGFRSQYKNPAREAMRKITQNIITRHELLSAWAKFYFDREVTKRIPWGISKRHWLTVTLNTIAGKFGILYTSTDELESELKAICDVKHAQFMVTPQDYWNEYVDHIVAGAKAGV